MAKNKITALMVLIFGLGACGSFYSDDPQGQVIYHWERKNTGIQKFASDHSECLRAAEDWVLMPDFSNYFYSEEAKLDIRADWHSERGIWATYVPYWNAQPLIVNSLRDDESISPRKYRRCMEKRGYEHRTTNIPEITNIYVYKPQRALQGVPFNNDDL